MQSANILNMNLSGILSFGKKIVKFIMNCINVSICKEWWGLNDQIKEEAKIIGTLGNFKTITPDLYRGKVAEDAEEAGHYMKNLDWPGAIEDIQGAAKYLLSNGCKKVVIS